MLTIIRSNIFGYVAWQVMQEDNILVTFDNHCDAVDFIRLMEEI